MPAEVLLDAADRAGLTALQLHGSYDSELVRRLTEGSEAHLKLIQVVKVPVDGAADPAMVELGAALRNPGLFGVLMDAAKAGASGGLGIAFSWETLAPQIAAVVADATAYCRSNAVPMPKLLLAG